MTPQDQETQPAQSARPVTESRLSRRGLLRGAGGIGVAGLAAGVLVDTTAHAASARPATAAEASAAASAPLVALVHDARTGEVDLYTGEQHVRVHDLALARALARAATTREA